MVEKISYLDIKLNSPHKDVVVIKGTETESDPILFEGHVKLSLNSNMHFKKIKLSLIGEASITYVSRDQDGGIKDQIIEKLVTLKVDWDNLLVNDQGIIVLGGYGEKPVKSYKMKKLHAPKDDTKNKKPVRPGFGRTTSASQLEHIDQSSIKLPESGVDGTPFRNHPEHHSFLLPKGNYSLPFKVVLPSNLSETVEGLGMGKMLYHFQCSVQKGIFDKPIVKARYLRIFRTLHPSSISFADNVEIISTWPGKVDYKVYLNKKGIAIGSKIPIKLVIVPLVKGLKLKKVTAEIVQHHTVSTIDETSPEFEQIIGAQQIHGLLNDDQLTSDVWDIHCFYKVPSHLRDITQTCSLAFGMIQVKHRLRLSVHIKNANGSVSELRANLPITLYISTNVGHVFGCHADVDPQTGLVSLQKHKEDPVFKRDRIGNGSSTTTPMMSPLVTPGISPIGTPSVTPQVSHTDLNAMLAAISAGAGTNGQLPQISPSHTGSLRPNSIGGGVSPMFEVNLQEEDEDEDEEDESDMQPPPPLYENALHDQVFDISSPKSPLEQLGIDSNSMGAGYFELPRHRHRSTGEINWNTLSKVPSYNEALENDDEESTGLPMSPTYDTSFSLSPSPILSSLDRAFSSSTGQLNAMAQLSSSIPTRTRAGFKLQIPKKKRN